jgi:hypothetical protein
MSNTLRPEKLSYKPELWGAEETFHYEMRSALVKADLTLRFKKDASREESAAIVSGDFEARLPFRKSFQYQVRSRVYERVTGRIGFDVLEEADLIGKTRKRWSPEEGGERIHHEILHVNGTRHLERLTVPVEATVFNALLLPIVLRGAPLVIGSPLFSSIVASRRFYALRFSPEKKSGEGELRVKTATVPIDADTAVGQKSLRRLEDADFSSEAVRRGEFLWEPTSGVVTSVAVHVPMLGQLSAVLKKHSRT